MINSSLITSLAVSPPVGDLSPSGSHSPLSRKERISAKSGQLYLRFQLPVPERHQPLSAVMLMGCIQEVLSLPVQRLSPIPNMPVGILGLMNRGNRIFWLVDLGQLLGVSGLEPRVQQHSVMILRSGSAAIGLAVQRVETMQWLGEEQLQPFEPSTFELSPLQTSQPQESSIPNLMPDLMPSLIPFVRGTAVSETQTDLVLDAQAILQAPILKTLGFKDERD